ADMVGNQFAHVFRVLYAQVVTQAGSNGNAFNARNFTRRAVQFGGVFVAGFQVFTDARKHARQPPAAAQYGVTLTAQEIHIGGRAAQIGNGTGKAQNFNRDVFNSVQDGFLRTVL